MWQRLSKRFLMVRGEFDPKGGRLTKLDWIAFAGIGLGVVLLPAGLLAVRLAGLGANLIVLGLLTLTRHFPGNA